VDETFRTNVEAIASGALDAAELSGRIAAARKAIEEMRAREVNPDEFARERQQLTEEIGVDSELQRMMNGR
jgi:uncharacterized membrane protein